MIDTPKIPGGSQGPVSPTSASAPTTPQFPTGLASAAPQSLLNAIVVRHDQQGNAVLDTSLGRFTVTGQLPLPKGSNLTLRVLINTTGTQTSTLNPQSAPPNIFQAEVVNINGKPPGPPPAGYSEPTGGGYKIPYNVVTGIGGRVASATAQTTTTQVPTGTTGSVSPQATSVNISNGTTLEAVIIKPDPGAGKFLPQTTNQPPAQLSSQLGQPPIPNPAALGAVPTLRPADGITLHVVSVTLPNTSPASGQTTPLPPAGQSVPQTGQPHVPTSPNTPASPTLPQTPTPAATPITTNPLFTGTVIGTERSGEILLNTPLGTIKLPPQISLPNGTSLQLEALSVQAKAGAHIPQEEGLLDAARLLSSRSTSLEEAVATIQQTSPDGGREALQQTLPAPNKQFAAKLLWFLNGVKVGNVEQWMAPASKKLLQQAGKIDLIEQLGREFQTLRHLFSEETGKSWNALLFPVMDGDELHHGMLYIQRDGKGQDGEKQDDDTRFVIELAMSTLGEIQIDGLVRPQKDATQFDLYIRSKKPLSEEIRVDIMTIYRNYQEATGLQGQLSFQETQEFPVNPYQEMLEDRSEGGILA